MGGLWRSQPMKLLEMVIKEESLHESVKELVSSPLVHFVHPKGQSSSNGRYVREVLKVEELIQKLSVLSDFLRRASFGLRETVAPSALIAPSPSSGDIEYAPVYSDDDSPQSSNLPPPLSPIASPKTEYLKLSRSNSLDESRPLDLGFLLKKFETMEGQVFQFDLVRVQLLKDMSHLLEQREVLLAVPALMKKDSGYSGDHMNDNDVEMNLLEGPWISFSSCLIGTVERSRLQSFELLIWRFGRGTLPFHHLPLPVPIPDANRTPVYRNLFCLYFVGPKTEEKLRKLIDTFGANLWNVPPDLDQWSHAIDDIRAKIIEADLVISHTEEHWKTILSSIYNTVEFWRIPLLKEKFIYHVMNMFDDTSSRNYLVGYGWCLEYSVDNVKLALRRGSERGKFPSSLRLCSIEHSDGSAPSEEYVAIETADGKNYEISTTPPTAFQNNEFTASFQNLVDAYGTPRYGEINPGVFTIITFPFLFSLMFGDVGHGLLMFLFSMFLIRNSSMFRTLPSSSAIAMIYSGRYLMLLMGLFTIYAGFIYNEFFGIGMNFGSSWQATSPPSSHLVPKEGHYYVWGLDPAWKFTPNELVFINSLKMKLSVIIGVCQMSLGLFLSYLNFSKARNSIEVYHRFFPQILFLTCTFGYLCLLIFLKWMTPYSYWIERRIDPPPLLPLFIEMFLSPTKFNPEYQLFQHQPFLQPILLCTALACVPWLLLYRPWRLSKLPHNTAHKKEFIEHVIEGIEFFLGSVSHVASYLRLWALSLAHSQLSVVFWEKMFMSTVKIGDPILIMIGFAMWAAATIAILMFMESLSAFLHSLRLHWVEFQSKFYEGDGYRFTPYSERSFISTEALPGAPEK